MANFNDNFDNINNIDEFTFELDSEPEGKNASFALDSTNAVHSDDEVDLALFALPKRSAPRNTMARVLAKIANLPQYDVDVAALSIGLVPPRIKYVPPVIDANLIGTSETVRNSEVRPAERFNPVGYFVFGAWCSVCVIVLCALWPVISALVIGPTPNADLGQRWDAVLHWWNNLTTNFAVFLNVTGPYLLPVVSAFAGIAIMLYFLTQQPRRLWYDR